MGHDQTHADVYSDSDLIVVAKSWGGGPACAAIARAYREHALDLLPHLDGGFSFILADTSLRRLLASSDLTSRTPLAYWTDGRTVAVSSRLLALVGLKGVSRELDEDYLANVVTGFWSASMEATPLRGVKRLASGMALVAEEGGVRVFQADRLTPRVIDTKRRAECADQLWQELGAATERMGIGPQTCLSLSGGLDSAAIASVLAARQSIRAFSMVAPSRQRDESAAVGVLERTHKCMVNERIDCSDAVDVSAFDRFSLPDDPVTTPLAYLPARLRLWGAAAGRGFQAVIDGEGGDELFAVLPGLREALRQWQLGTAWSTWRSRPGRRAALANAFALPLVPESVRRIFSARRANDLSMWPSYLCGQARSHSAIRRAAEQFYAAQVEQDFATSVHEWLSRPATVGATVTHRQMASAFGITLVSPFLDRRVVEFVLGIPIEWMLSREYKSFLRRAAADRVPTEVRTRTKDVSLPDDLLRAIVSSEGTRHLLGDGPLRKRLDGLVRFERLQGIFDAVGRGYVPRDPLFWQQIEGMVSFAYWYSRASREYGIT
jgi:asparagine synthase (glutamine-hydrolysing)